MKKANLKTINGIDYLADDPLKDFTIDKKPSSNVEFFGYKLGKPEKWPELGRNHQNKNHIFIQFASGSSYIYKFDDTAIIYEMLDTASIGKFVSSGPLKDLPVEKFNRKLVNYVV